MNPFSFSPSFTVLPAALAISLGLGLMGCNQPETPVAAAPSPAEQPADSPRAATAFEHDWLALKAQGLSPKAMAEAAPGLRAKYGLPPIELAPGQDEAAPAGVPEAVAPQGLGKTEVVFKTFAAKLSRINFFFVHFRDVNVGDGQTITIHSGAVDPGTDPAVIAFYKTTGSADPAAYQVKIVAWNDDFSPYEGVNASATWVNNTGSAKMVRVLGYNYLGENAGKTSFSVMVTENSGAIDYLSSESRFTSAAPIYDNNPPHGSSCQGPFLSTIRLTKDYSAGYGSGILAFNYGSMTGAYIRETTASLNLDAVLPGVYPNMVLGFYEGKNFTIDDINNLPYSEFMWDQEDKYLCPF
ncbi:MAG: hypothetical protein JF616_01800 [Fibrobacteres bacterium]|nr:hypothetical protein [Fibrobacterota bacterium]